MSALARFSLALGAVVSGSDRQLNEKTDTLHTLGADVYQGEDASKVEDADIVVYSSAIKESNSEFERARQLGKTVFERHEFLGIVTRMFEVAVAVAGTHGKTTVTSMIAHILKCKNKQFTAFIGGDAESFGNYYRKGKTNHTLVTEACEYKKGVLSISAKIGVVTNADCDHPDCYENLEKIVEVYDSFLENAEMRVFSNEYCSKSDYGQSFIKDEKKRYNYFVYANGKILTYYKNILGEALVFCDEFYQGKLQLENRSDYNIKNALLALGAVQLLGVTQSEAIQYLKSFKGVKRRYEKIGQLGNAELIFDFAHHPTEISAVLSAEQSIKKTLVVFQPHTYSRTAKYLDGFIKAFENCEQIIIMPTYPAREVEEDGITSLALVDALRNIYLEKDILYFKNNDDMLRYILTVSAKFSKILFLGAGNIYDLRKCFV